MHDPLVSRGPPASRRDPKQGTLIGQSGQARRLPHRQQAYGSPAPTTMRAGYSEGSNTRLRHYALAAVSAGMRPTSSPPTLPEPPGKQPTAHQPTPPGPTQRPGGAQAAS